MGLKTERRIHTGFSHRAPGIGPRTTEEDRQVNNNVLSDESIPTFVERMNLGFEELLVENGENGGKNGDALHKAYCISQLW